MIAALLRGTGAVTSAAHPYSFWVSGEDIVDVVDRESITINAAGNVSGSSGMTFRIVSPDGAYGWGWWWAGDGSAGARWGSPVQFYDHTRAAMHFAGWVANVRIRPMPGGPGVIVDVRCVGLDNILDWCVTVPELVIPDGTDVAVALQSIVGNVGARMLTAFAGTAYDSAGGITVQTTTGLTLSGALTISAGTALRSALGQLEKAVGTALQFGVDPLGRIVAFSGAWVGAAPVNLDDVPTGGEVAANEIEAEYDTSRYVEHVYIDGVNAAGTNWGAGLAGFQFWDGPAREQYASDDSADSWASWRRAVAAAVEAGDDAVLGGTVRATIHDVWGWGLGQNSDISYGATNQTVTWYVSAYTLRWLARDIPVYALTFQRLSSAAYGGGTSRDGISQTIRKQYTLKQNV